MWCPLAAVVHFIEWSPIQHFMICHQLTLEKAEAAPALKWGQALITVKQGMW